MEKTLMQALMFAGITKKEGQDLKAYGAEVKELTDADRAWFAARFLIEYGIKIVKSP